MKNVGVKTNPLRVTKEFQQALETAGCELHYRSGHVLFKEGAVAKGVFLILRGEVLMGLGHVPRLDRCFSAGSLLGLPSTFSKRPYSLTATTTAESDVVYVRREDFLLLMLEHPDLCREAADILGRQVIFVRSALAERPQR
jgi:CRP-like cAMP-binding protein